MIDTYFKQYFWSFRLLTLGAAAFMTARVANAYVGAALLPSPDALAQAKPESKIEGAASRTTPIEALLERNVFHAQRQKVVIDGTELADGKDTPVVFDLDHCPRSRLQANLLATLVALDDRESIAVFMDQRSADAGPLALKPGDPLLDGAEIFRVDWRQVYVKHNGTCERFSLEEDDPKVLASTAPPVDMAGAGGPESDFGKDIRKTSGNNYEISRGEIDNVLNNVGAIANQARIIPNFVDGKSNGFKLFAVQPNSIYSKLGIENGDVVQRINGYEMNAPDKALEVYGKLRDAPSLTVDVLRNGKTMTLSYQIR